MSKEAIEKAKKFLDNLNEFTLNNSTWEDLFDFSNSNKSYFVFLKEKNVNDFLGNSYCQGYCAKFVTKKELFELIITGREFPEAFKPVMQVVSILDVKKNKIVKAKICTQIKLQ